MTDKIIEAARQVGGTAYTNRHVDGTAFAFGPDALTAFYRLAYNQGLEDAAKLCEQVIEYPAGHQGRWEGYGPFKATRNGTDCATAIRNLKDKDHG